MKRRLSIILYCLLMLSVIMPFQHKMVLASETPVKFADINLEKAVREAIKRPEGEMYKNDLTEILSLNADGRNISSLEGIENLTNINSLSLAKNYIVDITPLCILDKLSYLNLYNNRVKSIESLGLIDNLEKLVLDVNQIVDISVLNNKVNLKELSVCANPVKDLEVLRTLPNLTLFHFGENQNVDIRILEYLPNLTDLRWAYTGNSENIDVIKNLTKLEKAILCGNKIKDITPLAKLTNLSELYMDQNEISDITALVDNCTNGGFSKGHRFINISNNNLDIAQGSKSHNDILTLIDKGISITFEPQNPTIPNPINKVEVELVTKVVNFKVGEATKLEYKVINNMSEEKEVTLIIGVYNLSNRLIEYVKTSKIVKIGETVNLDSTIIKLPVDAYKVKAFVWDNLNNMNPYINDVEIPVN
jgi:Leucine-rich repeat (LRR) protein